MILLDGASLTLADLVAVADGASPVALAPAARAEVARSRAVVDRLADGAAAVYGVNTGFGNFAETRISRDDLARLQTNLIRSHATGVDAPLPPRAVRAMMALRANVLAKGFSGIRPATLEALLALLQHGIHPYVPSRGSVGASGDLAPLAHLALVLIGEGEIWDGQHRGDGAAALRAAHLMPVDLGPKEGLALINGTQASTAVLALALDGAWQLARAADIIAALSIDALLGSVRPFDARIHAARPFAGQQAAAANVRQLLADSPLNASHAHCGRVQDAYSERCVPQVHGAAREAMQWVQHVVATEMNAATDNPMVFADADEMVSGGNFHGAPVALAADTLALALTQLATISERRTERLLNPTLSGLPAFLTRDGGLHSGYMMVQVTAAALTSEIKSLCHAASADTIPTSASKEDHVSMSMGAALKAERALELARTVLAIELLCACQAIDLRAPLMSSPRLMAAHAAVRAHVPTLTDDRPPAPDIVVVARTITSGALERSVGMAVN
jgi:histidine ammonia-lyase